MHLDNPLRKIMRKMASVCRRISVAYSLKPGNWRSSATRGTTASPATTTANITSKYLSTKETTAGTQSRAGEVACRVRSMSISLTAALRFKSDDFAKLLLVNCIVKLYEGKLGDQ